MHSLLGFLYAFPVALSYIHGVHIMCISPTGTQHTPAAASGRLGVMVQLEVAAAAAVVVAAASWVAVEASCV